MTIRIVSLAYTKGLPHIIGELLSNQVRLSSVPLPVTFVSLPRTLQSFNLQVNGVTTSEGTPSKTPKRNTEERQETKKKVKKNDENNGSTIEKTVSTPNKPFINEARTPREKIVLPEGFKVLEKKTEKKSWKEYEGPDGTTFSDFSFYLPHS